MVPYLLSTENNINEFENIIQKRFFRSGTIYPSGQKSIQIREIYRGKKNPIIWINDLEKGIIGWDMGMLVNLARAAYD